MAGSRALPERVTLLGIRHHGPGSARMVAAALEAVRPELVLVEGPPEADVLLEHLPALTPPVAVLLHVEPRPGEADPGSAGFWPFAEFSPEWQALSWANRAGVPARFVDLPAAVSLSGQDEPEEARAAADPLGELARAAGFDDPERWWEDVVERHESTDPRQLALAVAEAMGAMREELPEAVDVRTLLREAAMRQAVRRACKDVAGEIVVVCGAWHVPALRTLPPASADAALLRGRPRRAVSGTWVPWSHGRLTAGSGYGAGIASPGWYAHLWGCAVAGEDAAATTARWFAGVCGVLRGEDLPASTASAVEAVRLADALAALRGRPSPGLSEVSEAALAVLCGGDEVPLRLVRQRLVVGERLGRVGGGVPRSPLAADLERAQRRLRLPPSAEARQVQLDLRTPLHRERSMLLRGLEVLGVPWGRPDERRSLGTFAETWELRWDPGFAVAVAEAARHGTTVAGAADRVLRGQATQARRVAQAAAVLARAVGCELPGAVLAARAALDRCAAAATDAVELLAAVPGLATTVRYGSVRGTDPELLRVALHGLLARGCVGLPPACRGVDDETAERVLTVLDGAHEAVRLAADAAHRDGWRRALLRLVDLRDAHGLPAGRATRLLWESGDLDTAAAATRLHRAVSAGDGATAFVAGFLRGSASLLAADPRLFGLVDAWLTGLSPERFDDALPLLRRAVAEFSPAERRLLGQRVGSGPAAAGGADWDEALAGRISGHLRGLLGVGG
jgi:hypothetical protein